MKTERDREIDKLISILKLIYNLDFLTIYNISDNFYFT